MSLNITVDRVRDLLSLTSVDGYDDILERSIPVALNFLTDYLNNKFLTNQWYETDTAVFVGGEGDEATLTIDKGTGDGFDTPLFDDEMHFYVSGSPLNSGLYLSSDKTSTVITLADGYSFQAEDPDPDYLVRVTRVIFPAGFDMHFAQLMRGMIAKADPRIKSKSLADRSETYFAGGAFANENLQPFSPWALVNWA